jgi:hypothetical protein
MRRISLLVLLVGVFALAQVAYAQQLDVAFGVGSIQSKSNLDAFNGANGHTPASIGGGAAPAFSADYIFKKGFGIQGEVAWRGTQTLYGGYQPFRPILYDFNAMYAPKLGKRVQVELLGGIGSQSSRFYGNYTCTGGFYFNCTDYQSSNHLLGHVGGGVRFYLFNSIFVRPEAHAYFVHNNWEFNSAHEQRYGVSIGYTFGTSD